MDTPSSSSPKPDACPACCGQKDRRGFVAKALSVVLGGFALLVPGITGVVTYLNPLRQKGRGGEFMKITSLASLPEDGTPRKFPVIANRTDAWNHFPNEPIGAVMIRRVGKDKLAAFQVICPHAGCSIGYESGEGGGQFFCPCHAAHFDLEGKRLDNPSPSPRDMDTLAVELRGNDEVWVQFQQFETGSSKKVAKA